VTSGHALAERRAWSSSPDGAELPTTTSVTRRTTRPDAVRIEIWYVPGASRRPCTFPVKRTRFKPA